MSKDQSRIPPPARGTLVGGLDLRQRKTWGFADSSTLPQPFSGREGGHFASALRIRCARFAWVLAALVYCSSPAQGAPLDYRQFAETAYRYADIAYASYADAAARALDLKNAIFRLVTQPDANKLTETRASWLGALEAYSRTEVFRFPGGPMDGEQRLGDKINPWPVDEAYIDYIEGVPNCGFINDVETYPRIDKELLLSLNKKDGPNRVTLGLHAIEYALWGEDAGIETSGTRPYTDFLTRSGRPNGGRRVEYLVHASDLLLEHLESVAAQWKAGDPENFRASFLEGNPKAAMQKAVAGLSAFAGGTLETKLRIPYENREDRREQARFADATTLVLRANAVGLRNVFRGSYDISAGAGIDGLLRAVDRELEAEFREGVLALIAALDQVPIQFDRAVIEVESRPLVSEALERTRALDSIIDRVAKALGLEAAPEPQ